MAQHDYVIDNSTGANVRADINNVLQAIATNNSGSDEPSTTFATQFFADTNAGIMKLRNTSNNGYVNLFTLAGGIDVDAASNFNEDVTFQCASGTIVFDKSANDLTFSDSVKARFGDSNDLTIFHDGSNSHIEDAGTGSLLIKGDGVSIGASSGEFYFRGFENGASSLRFDNSQKLVTLSNGVQITGTVDVNGGGITLEDSAELQFGASADLVIKHNGSDSFINDTGTGALKICSNLFRVNNAANSEAMIKAEENGSVELYHNGNRQVFTIDGGMNWQDNKKAEFGNSGDLKIYHDGSNSYIDETRSTNNLFIRGQANINIGFDSEIMATFSPNGHVNLFFDDESKAATVADGFRVTNKLLITNSAAANSNMKMSFRATISASSSQTFEAGNIFAMGTVTVFGSRGAGANNATIATGVIHPIHIRGTSTAGLGSAISGISGSGGSFSYSVAAASKGITIINPNSTFAVNVMVHFDLTGFVG